MTKDRKIEYRKALDEMLYMLEVAPFPDIVQQIVNCTHVHIPSGGLNNYPISLSWERVIQLQHPDRDYTYIIKSVDLLIEAHPNNGWLRCVRARLLWGIEYYMAAKQDLEYALCLDSRDFAALQLLAETYYFLEHYELALSTVTKAIQYDRLSARGYLARVLIYEKLAQKNRKDRKTYYVLVLSDLESACLLDPSAIKDETLERVKTLIAKL